MSIRLLLICTLLSPLALGQHKVDLRNTYERVICVVPMVGSGTAKDPRRPMYAPLPPGRGKAASRSGILAFSYEISDDGKFAVVEFVARDRSAFKTILADPQVKAFQKGKAKRADIEAEAKKHKKDFDLDRIGVRLP